jgi:hypothetical protein
MPDQPLMRTGRTLSQQPGPCTLYRVTGDGQDECVGMVNSNEIAAAICEAVNARGIPLPGGDDLPTASQIRTWLAAHDWTPGSAAGPAGAFWYPPSGAQAVGIPRRDDDPFLTTGALNRIAERSGLPLSQVTQEMLREV